MNLEWVQNNVHGLLTVWTVSGEADFDLVTTGDFSHEVNFPNMEAFTKDSVAEVLYAVDNTASLIAAHAVLREAQSVLREQGLDSVLLTDRHGDEKSLDWYCMDGAYNSLTFWTNDNKGMLASHLKGELLFRRDFGSIEELAAGYMEALEALNLAGRIFRGKQILNDIHTYLKERGISSGIDYLSEDTELLISWWDGNTRSSLALFPDDDDAYMSSCSRGKITFRHSYESITELESAYQEVLEAAHLITLTAGGASC
jgi:hypothetical protein